MTDKKKTTKPKTTKKVTPKTPKDKPENKPELTPGGLTLKQELFCQYYTGDQEMFANGTSSYIEAYDVDLTVKGAYMVAAAAASRLLKNVKVLTRINQLLDLRGLNDQFVDKQLEFLITQNAEMPTKIAAIREYNKLKKRVSEKPTEVKVELNISEHQAEQLLRARTERSDT
jgi:hypothetical protein